MNIRFCKGREKIENKFLLVFIVHGLYSRVEKGEGGRWTYYLTFPFDYG